MLATDRDLPQTKRFIICPPSRNEHSAKLCMRSIPRLVYHRPMRFAVHVKSPLGIPCKPTSAAQAAGTEPRRATGVTCFVA